MMSDGKVFAVFMLAGIAMLVGFITGQWVQRQVVRAEASGCVIAMPCHLWSVGVTSYPMLGVKVDNHEFNTGRK